MMDLVLEEMHEQGVAPFGLNRADRELTALSSRRGSVSVLQTAISACRGSLSSLSSATDGLERGDEVLDLRRRNMLSR